MFTSNDYLYWLWEIIQCCFPVCNKFKQRAIQHRTMIFKKRGAHSSAIFEKGHNFCDPNRKDGKNENGRVTSLESVSRHLKSRFSYIDLVLILQSQKF